MFLFAVVLVTSLTALRCQGTYNKVLIDVAITKIKPNDIQPDAKAKTPTSSVLQLTAIDLFFSIAQPFIEDVIHFVNYERVYLMPFDAFHLFTFLH